MCVEREGGKVESSLIIPHKPRRGEDVSFLVCFRCECYFSACCLGIVYRGNSWLAEEKRSSDVGGGRHVSLYTSLFPVHTVPSPSSFDGWARLCVCVWCVISILLNILFSNSLLTFFSAYISAYISSYPSILIDTFLKLSYSRLSFFSPYLKNSDLKALSYHLLFPAFPGFPHTFPSLPT